MEEAWLSEDHMADKQDIDETIKAIRGAPAKSVLEDLRRIEKTTGSSGAVPNTSKEDLLDLSSLREAHPDLSFRFVNMRNPGKATRRQKLGWVRLPETEGGRQVGDLAVFVNRRSKVEELRRERTERDRLKLVAYKAESVQLAEGMSRILRDRFGIEVEPSRLIAE